MKLTEALQHTDHQTNFFGFGVYTHVLTRAEERFLVLLIVNQCNNCIEFINNYNLAKT